MDIEKQKFSIFPNPAKDKIVLKSKEMGNIEIYNLYLSIANKDK